MAAQGYLADGTEGPLGNSGEAQSEFGPVVRRTPASNCYKVRNPKRPDQGSIASRLLPGRRPSIEVQLGLRTKFRGKPIGRQGYYLDSLAFARLGFESRGSMLLSALRGPFPVESFAVGRSLHGVAI